VHLGEVFKLQKIEILHGLGSANSGIAGFPFGSFYRTLAEMVLYQSKN